MTAGSRASDAAISSHSGKGSGKQVGRVLTIAIVNIHLFYRHAMLSHLKAKISRRKRSSTLSRHNNSDDPEVRKMKATIHKMMGQQAQKVECICEISLTFERKETVAFAQENLKAQDEGRPYFRRCAKEIGKHHQIVLWMRPTTMQQDFITDLRIGHALPSSPLFINGSDHGLQSILHERMKGDHRHEPTVCLWFQKDTACSSAIDDLAVSYSKKDETFLRKEKYEILPTNLEEFGLAPAHLWVRRIERTAIPRNVDFAKMTMELQDYMTLLSKDPNDPMLRSMVSKMQRRLQTAQAKDDLRSKCNPTEPLMYAKEFLALNLTELTKLQTAYDKIPRTSFAYKDKRHIALLDFCRYLGEKDSMPPFIRHTFTLSGANVDGDEENNDADVDFGTTLKCIVCYCMLGMEEVLQACFSMYDPKGQGSIDNSDFLTFLTMFHPYQYRGRTTRALREFDLPEDGRLSFGRLKELNDTFPHLLYPAFRIQETVQRQFMGYKWWKRKQQKFALAKELIRREEDASGT